MTTRKIDVGKIKGNFYGGLPFRADWSFNDGSSPSTLTIGVVNSEGVYPDLDEELTYSKVVTVELGEFKFNGYLTGYTIDKTPEQKILNLEYVDCSVDLDRYYVGLYKRHGLKSGDATNLIIVGKEYNPCDTNQDSMVDWQESSNFSTIDQCDPCPNMPSDKYQSSCTEERVNFEIWEVYYTFNELLSKIPLTVENNVQNINTNYKAQHTGTLKSVLSAWCSEVGLAYFWDPFKGAIVFVDRSQPLSPPDNLDQTENIVDYKYGASKKNTFSRGFIGYLAKQGQIKSYNCQANENSSFENLEPLAIADLFDPALHPKKNEIASREMRAVLSRYGKPIRDAYIWFSYYGMIDAKKVNEYKYSSADADAEKKVIEPFGNMKILEVLHPTVWGKTSAEYSALSRTLFANEELDALIEQDRRNGVDPYTNPSWYFFVAECDDELADSQFEADKDLGDNFLGKYWFKYYNTPIPGASNSNTQVETDAPDATVNWYISNTDVSSLDLFTHGHEDKSKIGNLAKTVKDDSKKQWTNETETKITTVNSFLLADRPTKFIPTPNQIEDYSSLFKWYQDYTPAMKGAGDGRPDKLFDIYPAAKNQYNIKLFVARQWNKFKINIEKDTHPLEPESMSMKKRIEKNSIGNDININIGLYGLMNNQCSKITIGSGEPDSSDPSEFGYQDTDKVDMVIYTPPGSIKSVIAGTQAEANQEQDPQAPVDNNNPPAVVSNNPYRNPSPSIPPAPMDPAGDIPSAGLDPEESPQDIRYRVFARPSASFPRVLSKVQYTTSISAENTDVATLDYNYKEIQEENINQITNSRNCIPTTDQLKSYTEKIGTNCAYSMSKPQKNISLKLPGIVPKIFDIKEALSSIQISISENSSYTTYVFEDKVVQPPGDQYLDQLVLDKAKGIKSLGTNSFTTAQVAQVTRGLS